MLSQRYNIPMLTKFTPDLSVQEIYATGAELTGIMGKSAEGGDVLVHTFKDPVLVTDNYRIGLLHPALRDTLFALYATRPRITEYDGISVVWDFAHRRVWSPSIDTLLIAKTLRQLTPLYPDIQTAIEIGCGSGFFSKYILGKFPHLETMTVNDISPDAIQCAEDNIADSRAIFDVGDGFKALEGKTFDLIVCNPPYIPRPNSVETNPYEGISLLKYLIHDSYKHLNRNGILVVGLSSLSEALIYRDSPTKPVETASEMEVPLKINNILNNPGWLSYLHEHGLTKQEHDGYEYWHRIKTVVLRG